MWATVVMLASAITSNYKTKTNRERVLRMWRRTTDGFHGYCFQSRHCKALTQQTFIVWQNRSIYNTNLNQNVSSINRYFQKTFCVVETKLDGWCMITQDVTATCFVDLFVDQGKGIRPESTSPKHLFSLVGGVEQRFKSKWNQHLLP